MNTTELATDLRVVISSIHKGLRKLSSATEGYSMTEIETVVHVYRNNSLLPSELAQLTRVKTQSMSQILKKLEENGIVKRSPSKEDKRKVYISVTAAGKKMVETTRYERDGWLKGTIEKSLTDKEIDILVKALPVLNKLIASK